MTETDEQQKDQAINENVKKLEPFEVKHTEKNDIKQIKDCNHNQMMCLINNIFNETNNPKLINNKQSFLSYFEQHKIDGNIFTSMNRKTFGNSITEFYDNK
eukprot:349266_1